MTAVLRDAIERRVSNDGPVNLAFGGRVTLLEVAERIEALLGHPLDRVHEPERTGDVRHSQAANDQLLSLFPDAQEVPFDDGLAATLAWMRERQGAAR